MPPTHRTNPFPPLENICYTLQLGLRSCSPKNNLEQPYLLSEEAEMTPNRVGQHLGNYRLLRFLGRGSFGDVYLGEHEHEHTMAAVKVVQARLTAEDLKEFINETSVTFRLKHPNIEQLLDFGVSADGTPFL